ncbi:PTS sugar transporter subunit IIC [Listeria grayi]|uniref:PTS sugar transporter subunit IIC n=1 Tax=Listeria grayi TaxID=1641 RepID=UPI001626D002|nr:PTS transporter subunit EIIC [Listeria grayi]MBC1921031.1 PTS sugar transporter subunit IIC [Listeria grayi]
MQTKSSFGKQFIEKLSVFSTVISSNKYIAAVRDAFASTIPLTIVASFFVLVNNLLLQPETGLLKGIPGRAILSEIGIQAYNGTLGILGIVVTFLIGYRLARAYGLEGPIEGAIALGCYLALVPNQISIPSITGKTVTVTSALTQTYTSATGMFLGIIAALISTTIMIKVIKSGKFKIKMPDSVPPAIANSFNGLFPAFLVILLFSAVEVIVRHSTGVDVPALVVKLLQAPLIGGFQNYWGILLYTFLTCFVFAFGVHGPFVFGAVSGPVLFTSLQQNIDAIQAGHAAPNIVTQPFIDCYVYITMISLVIALFIGSKRKDNRLIAKVGAVPAIFNISEPLMFGLPIVFNPIFAIPYCIVPLFSTTIAYVASSLHFVDPSYVVVPWVTPAVLSGYLTTGGDIRASILQIIIITVGVFIYLPFVIAANRTKV